MISNDDYVKFFFSEEVLTLMKNLKYANQLLGDRDGISAVNAELTNNQRIVADSVPTSSSNIHTYSCLLLLVTLFLVRK